MIKSAQKVIVAIMVCVVSLLAVGQYFSSHSTNDTAVVPISHSTAGVSHPIGGVHTDSHTDNPAPGVRTEVHRDNPTSQVHISHQRTEVHRDNPTSQVHISHHRTEVHRDNPTSQVDISHHRTEVHRDNPTAQVHISHQRTEVHRDNPTARVHISHQRTEVHRDNPTSRVHISHPRNTTKPKDGVLTSRSGVPRYHSISGNHVLQKKEDNRLRGFWDIINKSYLSEHSVRPQIGDYTCEDALCSEFLSQEDWTRVNRCVSKFKAKGRSSLLTDVGPTLVPNCHFANRTSHSANVILISFPGSGNTWVRGLLEKATGICTGSMYCDTSIWFSGSVGEGINSSRVLVVKAHNPKCMTEQKCGHSSSYGAAILLIRSPYDALVSYYKFQVMVKSSQQLNPHTSELHPDMFGDDKNWDKFVEHYQKKWHSTIIDVVLDKCRRPLLMVKYEDIRRNRTAEVLRMLDFLGVEYSPNYVTQCLADDVTEFHRQHTSTNLDLFTRTQLQAIQREVKSLRNELVKYGKGNFGVEEYLISIT